MDTIGEIEGLRRRLVILERRAKVQRLGLLFLGVALVVPWLMSAEALHPNELRTRKFELVDEADVVRARFQVAQDGQPSLEFLSHSGAARLGLQLAEED